MGRTGLGLLKRTIYNGSKSAVRTVKGGFCVAGPPPLP